MLDGEPYICMPSDKNMLSHTLKDKLFKTSALQIKSIFGEKRKPNKYVCM